MHFHVECVSLCGFLFSILCVCVFFCTKVGGGAPPPVAVLCHEFVHKPRKEEVLEVEAEVEVEDEDEGVVKRPSQNST